MCLNLVQDTVADYRRQVGPQFTGKEDHYGKASRNVNVNKTCSIVRMDC